MILLPNHQVLLSGSRISVKSNDTLKKNLQKNLHKLDTIKNHRVAVKHYYAN